MRWRPAATESLEGVFPIKDPSIQISAPGGLLLKFTVADSSDADTVGRTGTGVAGTATAGGSPLEGAGPEATVVIGGGATAVSETLTVTEEST